MKHSIATITISLFCMLSLPIEAKSITSDLGKDTLSLTFHPVSIRYDHNGKNNSNAGLGERMPQYTLSPLSISGHMLRLSGAMEPGWVEMEVCELAEGSAAIWQAQVVMTGKDAYVELPHWLQGFYVIRMRTSQTNYTGTIDL